MPRHTKIFVCRGIVDLQKTPQKLRGFWLLCFVNADLFSVFAQSFKPNNTIHEREQRIVFADPDIVAGMEFRAALTNQNVASKHFLPVRTLHAKAFRFAVAAVVRRTGSFL